MKKLFKQKFLLPKLVLIFFLTLIVYLVFRDSFANRENDETLIFVIWTFGFCNFEICIFGDVSARVFNIFELGKKIRAKDTCLAKNNDPVVPMQPIPKAARPTFKF